METSYLSISLILSSMVYISTAHTHALNVHHFGYNGGQRTHVQKNEHGFCAYVEAGPTNPLRLNPFMFTASHRTLPINTLVNVDTGTQSITVRITDHQVRPGHMLELSTKAASTLRIRQGAPVRCDMVVMRVGHGEVHLIHGKLPRSGRKKGHCVATWSDVCDAAEECCSGRCVHVQGGPGLCFPRDYDLRQLDQTFDVGAVV